MSRMLAIEVEEYNEINEETGQESIIKADDEMMLTPVCQPDHNPENAAKALWRSLATEAKQATAKTAKL